MSDAHVGPLKFAGRLSIWIGGLLAFLSLFLHYRYGISRWSLGTQGPLFMLLLIAATVTISVVTIYVNMPTLVLINAALGVYLFGNMFPLQDINGPGLGVGFWMGTLGSLGVAVGGILLLVAIWPASWGDTMGLGIEVGAGGGAQAAPAPGSVRSAGSPQQPAPAATPAPAKQGTPPVGWYPDPSDGKRDRFWSGVAWTEEIRERP